MAMTQFFLSLTAFTVLAFMPIAVLSQPPLDPVEQESVYRVLESVNPDVPWRSLFPDDLCASAPHGVVCDYSSDAAAEAAPHVTELSFGYVSDYSPNPPCGPTSALDPTLFLPLARLRKLFFYKCFTEAKIAFPDFSRSPSLEELVFVDNPAVFGSLGGKIGGLRGLRRFVLTGSSVSGGFPDEFSDSIDLEQLTLSRNNLTGEIPKNIFQNMKKLKILDLSGNGFEGDLPESVGNLTELLKLDLSFNRFSGKIPEALESLKSLEFMDLSFNRFGNFGLPLFLSEMFSLKELYLSGNLLGGQIPEIWGGLRGIMGIGLSGVGLVGNIPKSMGLHLTNICYLGLDNNGLDGPVPEEFGYLGSVSELNLENNNLSGRVPFSQGFVSKLGNKLKLRGNLELCVDEGLESVRVGVGLGHLKVCEPPSIPRNALSYEDSSSSSRPRGFMRVFTFCLLWVSLFLAC